MGKLEKVMRAVLSGASDANLAFSELRNLLIRLGFSERVRGYHFIYTHDDVEEILNLQPLGSKAKAY